MRIGLVSDTHGLMRPEALRALRGADVIIHGGDVGTPAVLEALRAIAPRVVAVRGNNDRGAWARGLGEVVTLELEGRSVHVLHDLHELAPNVEADVVVSGHSHKPLVREENGTLYVNPGSAGPRRFSLPICVAWLTLTPGRRPRARLVHLA